MASSTGRPLSSRVAKVIAKREIDAFFIRLPRTGIRSFIVSIQSRPAFVVRAWA
jgi:hypothetical protein